MAAEKPEWLDILEYPFSPHYFETGAGKMHYIDEGTGAPIVFVHGNPAWSFEFRNMIKRLSKTNRCIAIDHLGFGLSDKPPDWSYLPSAHADNLEKLLESLDLKDITIMGQDWGGPIGLSYALKHPDKVRALVISNTWLWSVKNDLYYQAFSKGMGGPVGRWLIKNHNFFARVVMKMAYGDKKKLTQKIHSQYLSPLAKPAERKGCWVFPKQIVDSWEWLDSLWAKRSTLADKKILLAWGMKDIAFRENELRHWKEAFPNASVVRYADAGHYAAEEKPDELCGEIEKLLRD